MRRNDGATDLLQRLEEAVHLLDATAQRGQLFLDLFLVHGHVSSAGLG
ncbi:hypothetical protein [Algiphilus sp.]